MHKTTIDIQAFINEHPFTKYQWMILALCFITVAMDGFDTAIIGFIASDLVQEWGVEKSALGPVMSAALVGLAVGALSPDIAVAALETRVSPRPWGSRRRGAGCRDTAPVGRPAGAGRVGGVLKQCRRPS